MSRSKTALHLTDDEVELIRGTICDTDLEGTVRRLLSKPIPVITGGQRISGTSAEIDKLLEAIWVEIRGYQRIDEERLGRELKKPRPGTIADRLASLYEKIEQHLS